MQAMDLPSQRIRIGLLIAVAIIGAAMILLAIGRTCDTQTNLRETQATPSPARKPFVLFINNHRHGPTNGLASIPQAGVPMPTSGGPMRCGHPGAVSEVEWKFLRTVDTGDEYEVPRRFPIDTPTPNTEKKTVTYRGEPLTIFEDDVQRVMFLSPEDLEKIRQNAAGESSSRPATQPANPLT